MCLDEKVIFDAKRVRAVLVPKNSVLGLKNIILGANNNCFYQTITSTGQNVGVGARPKNLSITRSMTGCALRISSPYQVLDRMQREK